VAKYGSSPNISIFADEEEAFAKMRAGRMLWAKIVKQFKTHF
jgi:methylmalonyl-CoA mutase N-terminal domain/subunit